MCCLIFIAAIVGFCAASAYGWFNGDPRKLVIGWDSDGNGCGFSDATKDYGHLYWSEPPADKLFDAISTMNVDAALELLNTGTCVKECPTENDQPIECKVTTLMANNVNYDGCVYQIDLAYLEKWGIDADAYADEFYDGGSSAVTPNARFPFRYETTRMYGYCLPKLSGDKVSAFSDKTIETFEKLFEETVMNDKLTSYIYDIATAWKVIAICSGTAIVLGYLYLLLIRCMGAVIVWLSIILLQLSLIAGGAYVYMQSDEYPEESDYRDWVKYAAYGIWGVAGLFLVCICCCWNAIRIGIAVYQTTAEYVSKNLRIFFLPMVAYIVAGLWLTIWLVSFIYVFSIGEPVAREAPYQFITEIKWEDNTRYIVLYQIFMLFWINAFVMGMCQFIIAASACIWYFEVNSDTGGKGTVGRGIYWAFRYHMGSIAFGAALIAICQTIRVVFEYYRRKIQAATKNKLVRCLLCYTAYLLWALEKCIKFITKNAYIQVALSNTFFCKAAWNAFALILKNVHRFGWLNTIGFVLNWFGVCSASFLNGFGAYIAITKIDHYKNAITQPLAPTIVIILMSFLLIQSFLSIFSFSLDAILQSFLLDESLGFAGQSRPDYIAKFKTNLEKYAKPGKTDT